MRGAGADALPVYHWERIGRGALGAVSAVPLEMRNAIPEAEAGAGWRVL
jgi:hypothetical protein